MSMIYGRACAALLLASAGLFAFTRAAPSAAAETLPSETPATYVPRVDTFDYNKREVMIPMRDGVKLKTIIVTTRPLRGPLNPTGVDHSTDTYDTAAICIWAALAAAPRILSPMFPIPPSRSRI